MRTLLLLSLFLAVPLASGTFKPTGEEDYWRATDIDLPLVKSFINEEKCRQSAELTKACAAAVQHGLKLLKVDVSLKLELQAQDFNKQIDRLEELASQSQAAIPKQMLYGSIINEALRHFDAHALIIPTDYSIAQTEGKVEEKVGMGFDEEVTGVGVLVRRIYPDSPAERGGLKVNDKILSVNGVAVEKGVHANAAFAALSKRPGQEVELVVERNGTTKSLYLVQAALSLRNVDVRFFPVGSHTVALVEVRVFARDVCRQIFNYLDFSQGQVAGVILDLRGNPGGLVSEAACVMGLFSGRSNFVSQKSIQSLLPTQFPLPQKSFAERAAIETVALASFPQVLVTVLVNGSSASASEMLAAAMQDGGRGWVIGEKTFGKGTTQLMFKWPNHESLSIVHTVSRFYRPSGGAIQLVGMTPDFEVPFRQQASSAERRFFREGDFFAHSLIKEMAPEWRNPRQNEVSRIRECIRGQGLDRQLSNWHQKTFGHEDFQKSYALAVLTCAT